jgi:hypothetical protein
MGMVIFTPRPLYPQGKSPCYPLDRRLGVDAVVKRRIPSLRRESNPRTPIVQPVAQRYADGVIVVLCSFSASGNCVPPVRFVFVIGLLSSYSVPSVYW